MKSGTENWNASSLTGIKFAYKCSLIFLDFIVHKPLEVDYLLIQFLDDIDIDEMILTKTVLHQCSSSYNVRHY